MQNLNFDSVGRSPSGLTNIWEVRSVHTGVDVGQIKWYAPWRRYTLWPSPAVIFDSLCLREIAEFLDVQMDLRKQTGDV